MKQYRIQVQMTEEQKEKINQAAKITGLSNASFLLTTALNKVKELGL